MKLPSSRLIVRAAESLGEDLTQFHQLGAQVAGRVIEDTGKLAKRARYRLRNGATHAVEFEDKVVADMRTRPLAYLLVGLGLACVVTLKIILDRKRNERD